MINTNIKDLTTNLLIIIIKFNYFNIIRFIILDTFFNDIILLASFFNFSKLL